MLKGFRNFHQRCVRGGFFVAPLIYRKVGESNAGGVEIIGVDGDGHFLTFLGSFGN